MWLQKHSLPANDDITILSKIGIKIIGKKETKNIYFAFAAFHFSHTCIHPWWARPRARNRPSGNKCGRRHQSGGLSSLPLKQLLQLSGSYPWRNRTGSNGSGAGSRGLGQGSVGVAAGRERRPTPQGGWPGQGGHFAVRSSRRPQWNHRHLN